VDFAGTVTWPFQLNPATAVAWLSIAPGTTPRTWLDGELIGLAVKVQALAIGADRLFLIAPYMAGFAGVAARLREKWHTVGRSDRIVQIVQVGNCDTDQPSRES
jgi:hypothetical protein